MSSDARSGSFEINNDNGCTSRIDVTTVVRLVIARVKCRSVRNISLGLSFAPSVFAILS